MELATEGVDFATGLADDDAGARRVDVDFDFLSVLTDQDVGQAGMRELVVDVTPNPDVFFEPSAN